MHARTHARTHSRELFSISIYLCQWSSSSIQAARSLLTCYGLSLTEVSLNVVLGPLVPVALYVFGNAESASLHSVDMLSNYVYISKLYPM
jgi:hypothetical protein